MKKIIALLLVAVLLPGCTPKDVPLSDTLTKDDLIIYDKDFNVAADPFENEDGLAVALGFPIDEDLQTSRGIMVGSRLEDVHEKYSNCKFQCQSIKHFDQVKGVSFDDFCDRYEEFRDDDLLTLIFPADNYGNLEIRIKDGTVHSIHTYSAAGLELREKAVQEKMKELDEKYAAG